MSVVHVENLRLKKQSLRYDVGHCPFFVYATIGFNSSVMWIFGSRSKSRSVTTERISRLTEWCTKSIRSNKSLGLLTVLNEIFLFLFLLSKKTIVASIYIYTHTHQYHDLSWISCTHKYIYTYYYDYDSNHCVLLI